MKKNKYMLIGIPLIAVILEILPYGAVLNFGTQAEDGTIDYIRETFSYFDLTPFGYANFGPFLTAILSCVLLIVGIIYYKTESVKCRSIIKIISIIAALTSILPLMLGREYYSMIGIIITAAMLFEIFYVFE